MVRLTAVRLPSNLFFGRHLSGRCRSLSVIGGSGRREAANNINLLDKYVNGDSFHPLPTAVIVVDKFCTRTLSSYNKIVIDSFLLQKCLRAGSKFCVQNFSLKQFKFMALKPLALFVNCFSGSLASDTFHLEKVSLPSDTFVFTNTPNVAVFNAWSAVYMRFENSQCIR